MNNYCVLCNKKERWKSVYIPGCPEYSSYYSISNRGQLRREARETPYVRLGKNKTRRTPELILRHTLDFQGYPMVGLKLPLKEQRLFKIASLVAWAFCKNFVPGAFVLHRDDNRTHSCSQNLSFGSHSENMRDMVIRGRSAKGSKHGLSILSEKEVRSIAKLLVYSSLSQKEIAERYGTTQANISLIKRGYTWGHITGFKSK